MLGSKAAPDRPERLTEGPRRGRRAGRERIGVPQELREASTFSSEKNRLYGEPDVKSPERVGGTSVPMSDKNNDGRGTASESASEAKRDEMSRSQSASLDR